MKRLHIIHATTPSVATIGDIALAKAPESGGTSRLPAPAPTAREAQIFGLGSAPSPTRGTEKVRAAIDISDHETMTLSIGNDPAHRRNIARALLQKKRLHCFV